jgi:hypothetical protein
MIRQGLELARPKAVLCALGCVMQPIEGQLAVVGEIALPKPVPAQDMESQMFSGLGQLQHACAGAHVSRGLQILNETQGRGWRDPQPTPELRTGDRAPFVLGAINLLERIFPKNSPALTSPPPAAFNKSHQEQEPNG